MTNDPSEAGRAGMLVMKWAWEESRIDLTGTRRREPTNCVQTVGFVTRPKRYEETGTMKEEAWFSLLLPRTTRDSRANLLGEISSTSGGGPRNLVLYELHRLHWAASVWLGSLSLFLDRPYERLRYFRHNPAVRRAPFALSANDAARRIDAYGGPESAVVRHASTQKPF